MILAVAMTVAQLADLVTVRTEYNPIAQPIVAEPLLALATKLALVAFVCAVAAIAARRHRYMPRLLLAFGTVAGLFGAWSNVA